MEITNTTEGSRVQVYQPEPGVPILQMVPEFRYTSQYLENQYYRGFQSSGILARTWSTNTTEGSRVQVYQPVSRVPILQMVPGFRYTCFYLEYQYYRGFRSSGILASTWNTNTIEGSRVLVYQPVPGVPILQRVPEFRYTIQYLEYQYYRGFQSSGILVSTWSTNSISSGILASIRSTWSTSISEGSRVQVFYTVPGVPALNRVPEFRYTSSTWRTGTIEGSIVLVYYTLPGVLQRVSDIYEDYQSYGGFQSSGIIPTTWSSWSISAIEDSRAQVQYPIPGVPGVPLLQRVPEFVQIQYPVP